MENCIPKFWEREREWKIAFPTFGNGKGNEKIIPNFREREWEASIPGNGREREFSLTSGVVVPKVIKLEEGDESRKINVPWKMSGTMVTTASKIQTQDHFDNLRHFHVSIVSLSYEFYVLILGVVS